jgi:integrase
MLRWACTVPAPGCSADGGRWLDRNPLEGLRFDREKNPVRPVASWERFLTTRETLQNLSANADSERDRLRWLRLELALVLAEGTGRRRGAIVGLAWDDVDFAAGKIRWRAEYDKTGVEWVVPASRELLDELLKFRRRLAGLGASVTGRLFPSRKDPAAPMKPELLTQWLAAAEDAGKLPKLAGGLWHPYRRKWASERMHLPLKAVADAGGWKDMPTLTTCYQHTDDATLLAVMSEPRKRREQSCGDLQIGAGAHSR